MGSDGKNQVNLVSNSDASQNSHLRYQISLSSVGRKWKIQVARKTRTRFRASLTAGIFSYEQTTLMARLKTTPEGPKEIKKGFKTWLLSNID